MQATTNPSVSGREASHRGPGPLTAPPRKPLYLTTPQPASIDAADDSLVLRRASSAPQRFPLARIERVICNRNATWTGTALTLCLGKGVPIVWLDGHGHALGNTQPRQPHPFAVNTALETYLELPDWPKRFDAWLARRRLETLTTWAMRATLDGHAPDTRYFETLKREYVYNGQHLQAFADEGEGWCHALTVSRLHREGLHSRYWGFNGTALDLAASLAGLLWAELNLDCGTLPTSAGQGVVLAHLFEIWAHRRETRLVTHLGDLKRHLAREIEAWH